MTLRQVTLSDARFLYELLKQRPAYANISHKLMPSFDEHQSFIASKPYAHWYVIMAQKGVRIGAIYLTENNEIGVAILKTHQGKGYAERAIKALMKQHPQERYLANIAPHNEASRELFSKLGFAPIQHTYELGMNALSGHVSQ